MSMKCTFFFKHPQGGWSESFWQTGIDDFTTAAANIKKVIPQRMNLLGYPVTLVGVRMTAVTGAKPYAARPYDFSGTGLGGGGVLSSPGAGVKDVAVNSEPDQLQTCFILQAYATSGVRKAIYLAGIPDDVTLLEQPNSVPQVQDALGQAWVKAYGLWRATMQTAPWGFQHQDLAKPLINVNNWAYSNGAGSELQANITPGADPYNPGATVVSITGNKPVKKGYAHPTGRYVVKSTVQLGAGGNPPNGVGVVLNGTAGMNPANFKKNGTIRVIVPTVEQIAAIYITGQVAHKRGKAPKQFRGRKSLPAAV